MMGEVGKFEDVLGMQLQAIHMLIAVQHDRGDESIQI